LKAQRLLTAANLELPDQVETISRELWMRVWSRVSNLFWYWYLHYITWLSLQKKTLLTVWYSGLHFKSLNHVVNVMCIASYSQHKYVVSCSYHGFSIYSLYKKCVYMVMGLVMLLLTIVKSEHRNEKVQVLAEPKVCLKWFHRTFLDEIWWQGYQDHSQLQVVHSIFQQFY